MKPSERIHQLGEQLSGKENDPTRMLVGIIAYLDEKDRFENPDWKAECALIAAKYPADVLSINVHEESYTTGCPEEGRPFEDEPCLMVRVGFKSHLKDSNSWNRAYEIAGEIEKEVELFNRKQLPIRRKVFTSATAGEVTA